MASALKKHADVVATGWLALPVFAQLPDLVAVLEHRATTSPGWGHAGDLPATRSRFCCGFSAEPQAGEGFRPPGAAVAVRPRLPLRPLPPPPKAAVLEGGKETSQSERMENVAGAGL